MRKKPDHILRDSKTFRLGNVKQSLGMVGGIRDHYDHGASEELMTPSEDQIGLDRLVWCNMITLIQ